MKTNSNTAQGVIYVATGEKYIRSAIRSAWSVRRLCPGLLVHLFSDLELGLFAHNGDSPFHSHSLIENPHPRSKVDYISQSPFAETLFLDTDTEVVVDLREVFTLLEKYDLALTHDCIRNTPKTKWKRDLPPSFPEFSSGVMLFRQTPEVVQLLQTWSKNYHAAGFFPDQITLRELLWETELKIGTLPPEYNTCLVKYPYVWRKGEAVPKILHLRRYHEGSFWLFCGVKRALVRAGQRLKGQAKFLVKK